jgi:hypothetical protein
MPIIRVMGALVSLVVVCACAAPNAAAKRDVARNSATQSDASCLRDTGSRIPSSTGCSAFGRSYSSDDIDRTGSTTVSRSLQLLDPSVAVSPSRGSGQN